jgi:hypothetical protein
MQLPRKPDPAHIPEEPTERAQHFVATGLQQQLIQRPWYVRIPQLDQTDCLFEDYQAQISQAFQVWLADAGFSQVQSSGGRRLAQYTADWTAYYSLGRHLGQLNGDEMIDLIRNRIRRAATPCKELATQTPYDHADDVIGRWQELSNGRGDPWEFANRQPRYEKVPGPAHQIAKYLVGDVNRTNYKSSDPINRMVMAGALSHLHPPTDVLEWQIQELRAELSQALDTLAEPEQLKQYCFDTKITPMFLEQWFPNLETDLKQLQIEIGSSVDPVTGTAEEIYDEYIAPLLQPDSTEAEFLQRRIVMESTIVCAIADNDLENMKRIYSTYADLARKHHFDTFDYPSAELAGFASLLTYSDYTEIVKRILKRHVDPRGCNDNWY